MADLYVRVDDRLIHGQTIVAWCPLLGIKEIIAVDDVSAQNPMLKTIMTMGVPVTYKTNIVTREEANTLLKEPAKSNRLVIVKRPEVLAALEENLSLAKAVTLGNLAKTGDSKYKLDGGTGIFYLTDQDVEILDRFNGNGIDVHFHQLPTSSKTDWEIFRKTI